MELERNEIERTDFAQARRGYDPEEVDRHLAEIAEAVDELKAAQASAPAAPSRGASGGTTSLAGAAAEQVRTIVEAAERSAAEIESNAHSEADRVTGEAKRQAEQDRSGAQSEAERSRKEAAEAARQTREQAESDAAGHVAEVRDATSEMRERAGTVETDLSGLVDELRSTISALVESVRTNAGSLESELQGMTAGMSTIRSSSPGGEGATGAAAEPDRGVPATDEPPAPGAGSEPITAHDESVEATGTEPEITSTDSATEAEFVGLDEPEASEATGALEAPGAEDEPSVVEDTPAIEDEPEPEPEPEPAVVDEPAPASGGGGDGAEGARLIALNMALNGTPRDETARYLSENFDLQAQDKILDEVYARVDG